MTTIRCQLKKIFVLLCCVLCTSCNSNHEKLLSGYIEGEYTYISSGLSGTLFHLNAKRGQAVNKNDLLFILDPEPDQAAMEAAKANVEQLQAQVALSKIQLTRHQNLYTHNATDKSTLDEKQTDFDSRTKQLQNAQKILAESEWALQQKTVHAPIAGTIFDTFYREGEKVTANQPVLAILAPANIKVLFYIAEKQLSTIHLGQTIIVHCDGCQSKTKATINYISPEAEYTPPIIYSQDTRYKLVYLVRAEMPEEIAKQFHPGQPLDIRLHE